MMLIWKRMFALLLVIILIGSTAPVSTLSVLADWFTITASAAFNGTCGDNITFINSDCALAITGFGEMFDYQHSYKSTRAPWYEGAYSTQINVTTVSISDGITRIGDEAFWGMNCIKIITIPKSVKSIGSQAFSGCSALTRIYYEGSLSDWNRIQIESGNTELNSDVIQYNGLISFGTYPQKDVSNDAELVSVLEEQIDRWESYHYYSGNNYEDSMKPSDYMRYADVLYGNDKYRCVVFDSYRPYQTTNESVTTDKTSGHGLNSSWQDDNGYYCGTENHYWFKYEPLRWIVLDPDNNLVVSERVIDAQPYNNCLYYIGSGKYYNDLKEKSFCSNYENSSILQWLNNEFYDTAFSPDQQSKIIMTKSDNSSYNTILGVAGYEQYDSASTDNKVFLLSYRDILREPLDSKDARCASGSDYAKIQGWHCGWTLRSAGTSSFQVCHVGQHGTVSNSISTHYVLGTRPAIYIIGKGNDDPDVKWTLSEDGVLTISGYGALPDYIGVQNVPWYDSLSKIKSVVIEEGITKIGRFSFAYCENMTQISIPSSVVQIESAAFSKCNSLKDIYYAGSYRYWNYVDVVDSLNNPFFEAHVHYQGTIPTEEGRKTFSVTHIFEENGHESTHDVVFNNEWLTQDNRKYNHDLARFCSNFAMLAYSEKKKEPQEDLFKKNLRKFGFQDVQTGFSTGQKPEGRNDINYFIAYKDINVGGKISTILFAGFIGSNGYQWFSNFDPLGYENKNHDKSLAEETTHRGFADARDFALGIVKNYVEDHKHIINIRCTKLLLTGHSRGAATANLLAAKAIDEGLFAFPRNIYAYTFATPNSVLSNRVSVDADRYKCIFNIVNPEDFVTKVLLHDWGFARYGITYALPSRTNDELYYDNYLRNMQTRFSAYTDMKYDPYKGGEERTCEIISDMSNKLGNVNELYTNTFWYDLDGLIPRYKNPFTFFKNTLLNYLVKDDMGGIKKVALEGGPFYLGIIIYFAWPDIDIDSFHLLPIGYFIDGLADIKLGGKFKQAHMMETYCAYMNSLSQSELTNYGKGREPWKGTVNCPLDIEIYNRKTNALVGRIVNNTVDETIAAKENSIVMSVKGESKSFWLPSNGDYRVVLTGNDNGVMDYTIAEVDSDVGEIKRVNFFDVEIKKGASMTGEFSENLTDIDACTLTLQDGTTLRPTENVSNENKEYQINVTVEGSGYASESQTAVSGDYVSLEAVDSDDAAFMGWYENGKLIERDMSLSFVAKKNRNLVAKFQALLSAAQLNCKSPSTVDYRSKVTVVASASYVPSGYSLALYDGSTQLAKGDNKTVRYKLGEMRADKTLTAKIVDASGVVQKDSGGNALAANIEINVNAGFFKKLAAFFKSMFGLLPNVEINPNIEAAEKTCVLSYDANGGIGAPANQKGYGKITVSDSVPTRDGYTFLGWALSKKAVNAAYQPGETILLVENRTLYAVWKKISFTLIYDANNGENPPPNQTGNGAVTLSSATPNRDGYTFLGWASSSSATTVAYQPGEKINLTTNTTLYAVWEKAPITKYRVTVLSGEGIIAVKGGGTFEPGDRVVVICSVKSGYTFSKWVVTSPTPLGNAVAQTFAFTMPSGNVTLVAQAVANGPELYTLTYSANGGKNPPSGCEGYGVITLSGAIPIRDGYVFLGWAASASAASAQYSANGSFTLSEDTVLYAVWAMKGDLNMDGEITLVDLTNLRGYLSGTVELTKTQKEIADLNNDQIVDDADLTIMRQILVGMST